MGPSSQGMGPPTNAVRFRQGAFGEVWVWLMDGTTKLSETRVATVPDIGYQIVQAR
jgi:hypothetical protein